jgi:peptide/nickel transport system ATP-binding protein
MTSEEPIIRVEGLEKHFQLDEGVLSTVLGRAPRIVRAVDDVGFALDEKDAIGIIGESGCGKSTLLKTLIGLHRPTAGQIYYRGTEISEFDKRDWKDYRRNVQLIFQDPFNSLDPKMTVEEALGEPLKIHDLGTDARQKREILEQVELSPPADYLSRLPKQLSGGEKQRVAIARSLILDPAVLLADEPMSMLDVSTQAAILGLFRKLRRDLDISIIYISHDISTVAYVCEEIHVMYLGRIVESSPTRKLLENPKHPYSKALVKAVPIPDPNYGRKRVAISGLSNDQTDVSNGCRFRDRCPERMDICEVTPNDVAVGDERTAACHLYYDHEDATTIAETPVEQDIEVD